MTSTGCVIYKNFTRPSKDVINLFRDLPVANIDDCMNRMAAVDPAIVPMGKPSLLGPAFTVKVPEGDNLMFHKAMDLAQPGDIVVIDAGGSVHRSIFGELMIHFCKLRKLGGVIVDGSIRDVDAIAAMDFPVYARAVTPNGPYKNGPGEINTPITFGGRPVRPGDIIVGDADGIVVIAQEQAEEIAKATKVITEKEHAIMQAQLKDGTYDRPWVDEKLKEIHCDIREMWPN